MRHGRTDDEAFMPDPRDLSDGEILEKLVEYGIEITIDDFKADAMRAGSPEMLAGNWAYMYGERSADEDTFLYSAVFELWKRTAARMLISIMKLHGMHAMISMGSCSVFRTNYRSMA